MPLLDARSPLPARPRRVLVAGCSGAGKTTLAARIGDRLGLPHTEIDGLFHGPGWTPRSSFRADVEAFSSGPAWVTEWQYASARPLLARRADLLVWLDLPRLTVLRQVLTRTVVRRVRRTELWHGNREPALRTLLTDDQHVVRWAWRTHPRVAGLVGSLLEDRPELAVVRLRSHREARAWLGRLPGPPAAASGPGTDPAAEASEGV